VYFAREIREDETNVKAILAYLNSQPAFKLAEKMLRVYGGGMYKLEPKDAEKIPCINPLMINITQKQALAALFDELCLASRKGRARELEILNTLNLEVRKLIEV